jgi:glyceraldehyde-3-phosphate dehydrogenase (NADP+)
MAGCSLIVHCHNRRCCSCKCCLAQNASLNLDNCSQEASVAMDFESLWLESGSPNVPPIPTVEATTYLVNGEIKTWAGAMQEVTSPIIIKGAPGRTRIGAYPMLDEATAMSAVAAAHAAYGKGMGMWPMSSVRDRIAAVEKYLRGLKAARDEVANIIMWEICKTRADSEKEVDRTITYIQDTLQKLKELEDQQSTFTKGIAFLFESSKPRMTFSTDSGFVAQFRRCPIGVVLCVGPFNYPFNETYTTLIPALVMGNTVVMKMPRTGVLCHWPTLPLFRDCFPPGVVNIISGSGRTQVRLIVFVHSSFLTDCSLGQS